MYTEPVLERKDNRVNMFIAYFLLFVLFNGKLTLEIALFGVVFAAALYAFSCKYLGYSFKKDFAMVRGAADGIRYLMMLAREIVKANLTVIRMILTPGFEPKPKLVQFRSGLREEGHRVALADSITLTPGTITCELNEDLFTVHCLDTEQYEEIENTCFEQALSRIEERQLERQRNEEIEKREQAVEESAAAPEPNPPISENADSAVLAETDEQEGQQE